MSSTKEYDSLQSQSVNSTDSDLRLPVIRACLFDMDGLLLDTEDKYTEVVNTLLEKYGKGKLPWSIKAQLQGRPGPAASAVFHQWANLPISDSQYHAESVALQAELFPSTQPLPGVPELLTTLVKSHPKGTKEGTLMHIALATSSHVTNFRLKTDHLEKFFSVFPTERRVLGDDPRIPKGRGKPAPDIFLLALKTINDSLPEGESQIKPEECLVFEDSIPGVEAGRRAGMQVVWCPHPMLKQEFAGQEKEILAGRVDSQYGSDGAGEIDDGWAVYLQSLVDFPYGKFGIETQK